MIDAALLPANFKELFRHWGSLRVERRMPLLADVLDRPLPQLQPWMGIVDVYEEHSWKARLVGTAMCDFFGADYTGHTFVDIVAEEGRALLKNVHGEIVRRPCGNYHLSICATSTGRECQITSLGLPIVRSGGGLSVLWFMEPGGSLSSGEVGRPVRQVLENRWIDLGHGTPT